jgi:hypothetical protein
VALGSPLKGGNPLAILFPVKMSRLLLFPSFIVFGFYFHLSLIGFIFCIPIFHLYSSGRLFRGLPQEYFILLRYSDHAGHGIALSSLPGIAGGLRNIIKGTSTQLGSGALQPYWEEETEAWSQWPLIIPPVPWPSGVPVPPAPPIICMALNGLKKALLQADSTAKKNCAKAIK